MGDLMKGGAEKAGVNVVYSKAYPIGSFDHLAVLNRHPAGQARLGLHHRLLTGSDIGAIVAMITGSVYKEFIDALGPLADNVTSASWWHWATPSKGDDVFGTTKEFYGGQ